MMGILDRFKKKPASAPLTDEKKLAEVAEYRSKEHPLLRNLQVKPLGTISTYVEGKVFCKLWNKEIDVDLYDDVPIEYAEKCAEATNAMPEELIDTICRAAKGYCLEFLDEISEDWRNEIRARLHVPVDANTAPREMLKCFEIGTLSVEPPKDPSRIGYQLSGNCDWEEEHGIEIVILDGRLVYLGEYSGESPWSVQGDESWNYAQRG